MRALSVPGFKRTEAVSLLTGSKAREFVIQPFPARYRGVSITPDLIRLAANTAFGASLFNEIVSGIDHIQSRQISISVLIAQMSLCCVRVMPRGSH